MVKRSEATQKATKALRKLIAERQVADALNTRNGYIELKLFKVSSTRGVAL